MPEVKVLKQLYPSRHLYLNVLLFVKGGTYLSLALQQAFILISNELIENTYFFFGFFLRVYQVTNFPFWPLCNMESP
jgi:hypothetical protein